MFSTDYVWWDLPEYGGVWEVWENLPLTIEVVTGYGRMNGHEIHAISRYGKPEGDEWNLWGPNGWIGFTAFRADGSEELEARSIKPAGAGTGHGKAGPFVPARFTPTYPIFSEDVMNPPAVNILSYGPAIRPGQTWRAVVADGNNPGVLVTVEIRANGSLHVAFSNPAGTNVSGKFRPVSIEG
jgi:hypothetical protein